MKRQYYIFRADQRIENCRDCPFWDWFNGEICRLTKTQIGTNQTPKQSKCQLVLIEGKVEQ